MGNWALFPNVSVHPYQNHLQHSTFEIIPFFNLTKAVGIFWKWLRFDHEKILEFFRGILSNHSFSFLLVPGPVVTELEGFRNKTTIHTYELMKDESKSLFPPLVKSCCISHQLCLNIYVDLNIRKKKKICDQLRVLT